MEISKAIKMAGGNGAVVKAISNRGTPVSKQVVNSWRSRNRLPASEWKGETQYASVICDLIKVMCNEDVHPIDLCPGAGQYMQSNMGEEA